MALVALACLATVVHGQVGPQPKTDDLPPGVYELDDQFWLIVNATPLPGIEGSPVSFSAVEVSPEVSAMAWIFGDGTVVTAKNPEREDLQRIEHTFVQDGSYTVWVEEWLHGSPIQGSLTIEIRNAAPIIEALSGPSAAQLDETVQFAATASDPGLEDRLTYSWDFGDDTTQSELGLHTVRHAFHRPGVFPVTLEVSDEDGGATTGQTFVAVGMAARVEMQGAINGSYAVPEGRLRFGIQGVQKDTGACLAILNLPSADGDLVSVGGPLPMPLTSGHFPVGDGASLAQSSAGAMQANVWPTAERGRRSEYGGSAVRGLAYTGSFEIEAIDRSRVLGHFDLNAVGEPIRVFGTFQAPLGGPQGLSRDHPCAPE